MSSLTARLDLLALTHAHPHHTIAYQEDQLILKGPDEVIIEHNLSSDVPFRPSSSVSIPQATSYQPT